MTAILRRRASMFTRRLRPASLVALAPLLAIASGCTKPYRVQDHLSLTCDAPDERLVIKNQIGDIKIIADAAATSLRANVTRIGKGTSPADAEQARNEITVEFVKCKDHPGAVVARARYPKPRHTRDYEVDWEITAPPDIAVQIECDIGDVTVQSIAGAVDIKTNIGDTHVDDARGGLVVTSDVGDIRASAAGDIRLRSDVGDVRLRVLPDTEGAVNASSDVGDIVTDLPTNRRGRLTADTDVGDVNIRLDDVLMTNYRQRSKHVSAELGGQGEPPIDISSDVGDVVVRVYDPAKPAVEE